MGTTSTYCDLNWLCSLDASDWIALIGIFVNAGLAYWVVRTIQNKLTNRRVLKDHFINEIKEIRSDYKTFFDNLYTKKTHPQRALSWFKLMNIKVDDLMTFINTKYRIKKDKLKPYQRELQELITDNEEFINQYKYKRDKIIFTETSKGQLTKFQQEHNRLFNDLIILINDYE